MYVRAQVGRHWFRVGISRWVGIVTVLALSESRKVSSHSSHGRVKEGVSSVLYQLFYNGLPDTSQQHCVISLPSICPGGRR